MRPIKSTLFGNHDACTKIDGNLSSICRDTKWWTDQHCHPQSPAASVVSVFKKNGKAMVKTDCAKWKVITTLHLGTIRVCTK